MEDKINRFLLWVQAKYGQNTKDKVRVHLEKDPDIDMFRALRKARDDKVQKKGTSKPQSDKEMRFNS